MQLKRPSQSCLRFCEHSTTETATPSRSSTFAVAAWSPWLEADKSCLEKIQQRAVSMMSGLKGATYEEKLREIGLTTLEERRHQADMLQAFKIIRGFEKVDSTTWFQRVDASVRTTRSAADPLNLRPQAAKLETRRNFFSNRVVEAWNAIPGGDIKRSKTVSSFKNAYRNHRENMVENAQDGHEKKTSQRRDHIRIQTHPERPYLGHWM
jgi:hypothetical protein